MLLDFLVPGTNLAKELHQGLGLHDAPGRDFRGPHLPPVLCSAEVANGRLQTQTWAVSSPALVWLLMHWGCSLKEKADSDRAFGLLRGLLGHAVGDCRISIDMREVAAPGNARPGQDFLDIAGGGVKWSGAHKNMFRTVFRAEQSLFDILLAAKKFKYKTIYSHLIFGVGAALERRLDSRAFRGRSAELLAQAPRRSGRRADRSLREEVMQLIGQGSSRNAYKTTSIAGAFGLSVAKHKAWQDWPAQRKYLLACRRIFSECTAFAVVPDKSRFSGRGCLGNLLFSPEVDQICCCAPQVVRTVLDLEPSFSDRGAAQLPRVDPGVAPAWGAGRGKS